MNKLNTLLQIIVYLSLILSSCTVSTQLPPNKTTSIPQPIKEQTPRITITSTLIETKVLPTLQPSLEKSATPSLDDTVSPQKTIQTSIPTCEGQDIDVRPPEGFGLYGTLVYHDTLNEKIFVISGTPVISSEMPISGKFSSELIGFTPNEEWLAYAPSSMIIDLISFDKSIKETKMDASGFYSQTLETATLNGWIHLEWINDNLIMASVGYRSSSQIPNPDPTDPTLAVFDPFLGRWRNDLLTELPSRDKHGGVAISPDLSRTLYVFDDNSGNAALGLYNRENRTRIWENQLFYDANIVLFGNKNGVDYTEWSPNSSWVAYTGAEDPSKDIPDQSGVYLLDRDGEDNHLVTNFSSQYKYFRSYGLRWSRDSRLLAFIVSYTKDNSEAQMIYVYDALSGQINFKCPIHNNEHTQLYWAPDNQHIAYSDSTASPLVVVDIKTGLSVQLAEKAVVGGWSDKFPTRWP